MYILWSMLYNQPAPVLSGEWGALALSAYWLPMRILTVLTALMLGLTIRVISRARDHRDKAALIHMAAELMQDAAPAVPAGPRAVAGEGSAGAPFRR